MVKKTKLLLILLLLTIVMVGTSHTEAHADFCDIEDPQTPLPMLCP